VRRSRSPLTSSWWPQAAGPATLFRDFATRRDPREALCVDEVDAVCAAASTIEGDSAADRLVAWPNRFSRYATSKRHEQAPRASATSPQISCPADRSDLVFVASRDRVLPSCAPLFSAAQEAG
jgi:hypothetical protein